LNDPFDAQYPVHFNIDRAGARALALEKMWRAINGTGGLEETKWEGRVADIRHTWMGRSQVEFERQHGVEIDRSIDSLEKVVRAMAEDYPRWFRRRKILCLSEVPDSVVMWAYYGESQKGLALSFRVPQFRGDARYSAWVRTQRIVYSDNIPPIFTEEFTSEWLAGRRKIDPEAIETNMLRLISTKSRVWAHEREWRTSTAGFRQDAAYEDFEFTINDLEGVTFGCLMPEDERQDIAKVVRKKFPRARLRQAVKSNDDFKLLIKELDTR
jgi:hypothetical protein